MMVNSKMFMQYLLVCSRQKYSQSVRAKKFGSVSLKMLSAMKLNDCQYVDVHLLW